MDAIVTEELVKHFADDVRAVDGIDIRVPKGQVFGFLGQNGSGKTTTVRMLTTLLRPTRGRAFVEGLDVVERPGEVRRRIGVALQDAGLDELMTGRELLQLQARLFGMSAATAKARCAELLAIVDLSEAADRRVSGYSGGMKRRLDLAAALVHTPSVLFLDEPTTGLDPISRDAIWRYVQELNRERGVTVFLTTQYLEEADRLADQVAIMERGRVVARGAPAELKATIAADVLTVAFAAAEAAERGRGVLSALDGLEEARVVDTSLVLYLKDGARAVPVVVRLLDDAGLRLEGVTLAHPTLDDVFLRATGHHLASERSPVATTAGR